MGTSKGTWPSLDPQAVDALLVVPCRRARLRPRTPGKHRVVLHLLCMVWAIVSGALASSFEPALAEGDGTAEAGPRVDRLGRCGVHATLVGLRAVGIVVAPEAVAQYLSERSPRLEEEGLTLGAIQGALGHFGARSRAVSASLAELQDLGMPAIVCLLPRAERGMGHYVLVYTNRTGEFRVCDPPHPIATVTRLDQDGLPALLVSRDVIEDEYSPLAWLVLCACSASGAWLAYSTLRRRQE